MYKVQVHNPKIDDKGDFRTVGQYEYAADAINHMDAVSFPHTTAFVTSKSGRTVAAWHQQVRRI